MPAEPVVDYYFAPISGYAYLGHARFLSIAREAGARVVFHPLDMVRVFAAAGSFPPAKYPGVRQRHRKADMARWAARFGLPLNPTPRHWPAPMALACRVIAAADPAMQGVVAEAVLSAVWVHDLDIADEASLSEALSLAGLDADALLASARMPGAESAADRITEAAIAAGIFGSPTYVHGGDWYFGQDRLDFLRAALG
jgi:2-hydroxychromene-2-carboxylate isomerase